MDHDNTSALRLQPQCEPPDTSPHAGDLVDLSLAVARLVPASAVLVWQVLWSRSDCGHRLAQLTLADVAAVNAVSKAGAKKQLDSLVGCGLVQVVNAEEGRRGGYTLRIPNPESVLAPGLRACRGDPQRPLFDAAQNVNQPASKVNVSPAPIIDHAARFSPIIGQDHGHSSAPKDVRLTNDLDGQQVNVYGPANDSESRLANEILARQREAKRHLASSPDDAASIRSPSRFRHFALSRFVFHRENAKRSSTIPSESPAAINSYGRNSDSARRRRFRSTTARSTRSAKTARRSIA